MNLVKELDLWGPTGTQPKPTLAQSQQYCRQLAMSHYENFAVVSWLFPRHLHQHLCNVYAYCRWADDLADETERPADSLRLLDWWEAQLAESEPRHPVFIALRETIREQDIPLQPFRDLLVAFRQDQVQTRYENWDELADYCRHSANPVGRIVLHLGNAATPENLPLSDSICTGLQLINFCQDVARDYAKGRIYSPRDEREKFGWNEERFAAQAAHHRPVDDSFRQLLQVQVDRADTLLRKGEPLITQGGRDLRMPVRLFIAGGLAIARAIRQQHYDVWSRRPVVSKWRRARLLVSAWWSS